MADISSLYPQPPQQQNNIGNILQTISAFRNLQSQQAVGSAFQKAIGADGSFDPNAAITNIKNDPNAAYAAPQAVGTVLQFRGQNISNATSQFGLALGQNQAAMGLFSSLLDKPNVSKDDVINMAPTLARAGIPASIINGTIAGLSDDPRTLKSQLGTLRGAAIGPAGVSGVTTGPVGPSGEPTQVTVGSRLQGPQTLAVGQSPLQQADQAAYINDQAETPKILANLRPLQQALPLIEKLSASNFGVGSPELAKLKSLLVSSGFMDPNDTSLPTREMAQKYLTQAVARSPHASDLGLSTDKMASPNFDITQPANTSLIKNQIAMSRMDAAAPLAAGSASNYQNIKSNYYQSLDQRAFKFDLMTPSERAEVQKELGPPSTQSKPNPAYDRFLRSYMIAKKVGVTPSGQ